MGGDSPDLAQKELQCGGLVAGEVKSGHGITSMVVEKLKFLGNFC
jgi:hypothetical protein